MDDRCNFGKMHHNFKTTVYCKLCDRENEVDLRMRCRLNAFGSLTKRVMGCVGCERQIVMYFYCQPGREDYDHIGHGPRKLIMTVKNIDEG